MSRYEWLLFLHLLGAAAVFTALVFFTAVVFGAIGAHRPGDGSVYLGLARPGGILFDIGGFLLLVFGIWLAFDADYGITDEWVLGALVLFAVASYAGTRTRIRCLAARSQGDARAFLREQRVPLLYALTVVSVLAMLALMVFKPGAK